MEKFAFLQDQLDALQADDLLRRLRCIRSTPGSTVMVDGDSEPKVNFCSNDYLNIAADPHVAQAVSQAVRQWGYGASASRLICGTMSPHVELEERFAAFVGKEACIMFPSGWMANEAVLRTIPQKGDLVLMDKSDHASIIDAAKAGEATFRTWRRDKPDRLRKLLAEGVNRYRHRFIVTESVFSMDGDTADLELLVELKNEHDAILIVDEAHSAGCMGSTGAGLAEERGLLDQVDIMIAPLGKAFGAAGAMVAACRTVVDYLINRPRPFIYTTAPAPVNCAAVMAALDIVQSEPQRKKMLADNAAYLRNRMTECGLDIANSCSHIVPVIIGSSKDALAASEALYEKGFLLMAIRPPTVPAGSARLRVSVQSRHTQEQMDALVDALKDVVGD